MDNDLASEYPARADSRRTGLWRRPSDPLRNPEPLIRRVYSYVAYRIGDGQDAEDVTSEVFERALRYRDSYDQSKGDATAWVLGIARRTLAEHYGRTPPTPVADDDELYDEAGEGLEDAVLRRLDLAEALAALPERDRDLLSLRYGADLKARDIAGMLEMDTHAVEVALSRATRKLRGMLEETSPDV
ncbi:MAG: RNA polymerase sigma factor [Gaiellales bacterium]